MPKNLSMNYFKNFELNSQLMQKIKILDLSYNSLNNNTLFNFLEKNNNFISLHSLKLNGNDIDDLFFEKLMRINCFPKLEHLYLNSNRIGDPKVKVNYVDDIPIDKAFENDKILVYKLRLMYKFIEQTPYLTKLTITKNPIAEFYSVTKGKDSDKEGKYIKRDAYGQIVINCLFSMLVKIRDELLTNELIKEKRKGFNIKEIYDIICGNNHKNLKLKKNIIKENLFNILNYQKEELLLLFNVLLFVVQNKEINISKILLKIADIVNIFDNTNLYSNKIKNIDINNSVNDDNDNNTKENKISFNKNIFNFNNYYFSIANINTSDIQNNYNIPELLSNLLNMETPFLPITYQVIYQNIINLTLDENYVCHIEISERFVKNIEAKYKSVLFFIYSLFNNETKNRDNCYEILYNQWLLYKDLNNKSLLKIIKKKIISSLDLLSMSNIDINSDWCDGFETYTNSNLNKNNNDSEIFLKNKKENICFETNILIFMLIYDLKKIYKKRKNKNSPERNNNIQEKLLKNKFPLDYSSYDFQIGSKYDIDSISPSNMYKQQIQYKIIETKKNKEKVFIKCEIFFYRSFLYFGLRNKEEVNKVLIFKKIDIKNIEANKDYNDKNGGENCVQLKVDDGNNEIIILKFENRNKRKEFKDLINEKIMTSNNDERLLFSQYFEELIAKFKNEDSNEKKLEDF